MVQVLGDLQVLVIQFEEKVFELVVPSLRHLLPLPLHGVFVERVGSVNELDQTQLVQVKLFLKAIEDGFDGLFVLVEVDLIYFGVVFEAGGGLVQLVAPYAVGELPYLDLKADVHLLVRG